VQGFVALKRHVRDGRPRPDAYEIYFALARECWGRGLASRALAAFLDELDRRLRPGSVHASLDPERNPAARRVLEKQGFARECEVGLAEYAGPGLARGSIEVELGRVRDPRATSTTLAQAAFRIGQLADAGRLDRSEALRAIEAAFHAGGLGGSLDPAAAEEIARRGFETGAQNARYAIYTSTTSRPIHH
jgi:hypothetical protein